MSTRILASRIGRLAVIIGAVACVACADRMTAPSPTAVGKKAFRDSVEGDSTLCHSGFTIISGRIVCNGS